MTVDVTRGPLVESRHTVEWVVADAGGRIVEGEGDHERPILLRSAAKPFQAMAVIAGGAADAYGFSEPEIAIVGGSHHGEPEHLETVAAILRKSGVPVGALRCGAHEPFHKASARAIRQAGEDPTPLHSNCSGKHAGLLALARHMGAPLDGYMERGHPAEASVFRVMAAFLGMEPESILYGVDGCGLPAGAASLLASAMAFARFATSERLPDDLAGAAARLRAAQARHPVMVNGTEGFNTALLVAAPRLVAKSGAEGVFCVGHMDTGQGLALKVLDGASRAVAPATVALLHRLGWLDVPAAASLESFATAEIRNVAGAVVGCVRAG